VSDSTLTLLTLALVVGLFVWNRLPVEFVAGSFLPVGSEHLADRTEEFAWLRSDAPSAYDDLGLDPRDFDLVFAYPWPGEEHVLLGLFDRCAADGALLVTYQGKDGVRVRRRRAGRRAGR